MDQSSSDFLCNDIVMNNDDNVESYDDVECNLINKGKFLIVKASKCLINSNYTLIIFK